MPRLAAATGYLGQRAYVALKMASRIWKPDVRECERINKSLKLFWSRTPNGTRELCSARAALRHQLGPTQTAQPPGAAKKALKWSTVKPAVDTLTRKLLESWDEKRDVLCATDRWCPAAVPDDHPSDDVVKRLQPKLNPSLCETQSAPVS